MCEDLAGRILPSDIVAANAHVKIVTKQCANNRSYFRADCQIGAVSDSRGVALATRDALSFGDVKIDIIDPWTWTAA